MYLLCIIVLIDWNPKPLGCNCSANKFHLWSVHDLFMITFQTCAQVAAIGLKNKQWQATILPPFMPNWLSISYLSSCVLSLTTGSTAALISMDWLENPFLPLVTLSPATLAWPCWLNLMDVPPLPRDVSRLPLLWMFRQYNKWEWVVFIRKRL